MYVFLKQQQLTICHENGEAKREPYMDGIKIISF